MDRGVLLAEARANGIKLGVPEDSMDSLKDISNDVLQLMARTKSDSGFATILDYPKTNEGEARWVLE